MQAAASHAQRWVHADHAFSDLNPGCPGQHLSLGCSSRCLAPLPASCLHHLTCTLPRRRRVLVQIAVIAMDRDVDDQKALVLVSLIRLVRMMRIVNLVSVSDGLWAAAEGEGEGDAACRRRWHMLQVRLACQHAGCRPSSCFLHRASHVSFPPWLDHGNVHASHEPSMCACVCECVRRRCTRTTPRARFVSRGSRGCCPSTPRCLSSCSTCSACW